MKILAAFLILIAATLAYPSPPLAQEVDTTKVIKPILMLLLYCNAANIELKPFYERAPQAPPWNAQGKRAWAFSKIFGDLDFKFEVSAKAVKDKSLTENEVRFLQLTAQKDAKIWGEQATPKCGLLKNPEELEICLRSLNSEVFKCFQQLNDNVKSLAGAP